MYDVTVQYFAKIITKGQVEFKKILSLYNSKATDFENGQADMFEGILSKSELLQAILKQAGYGNEQAIERPDTNPQATVTDGSRAGEQSDIPESVSQGEHAAQNEETRRTKEIATELQRRSAEALRNAPHDKWEKNERGDTSKPTASEKNSFDAKNR